jgi:uncharacterized protein YjbJ (UPF0337 family)
MSRQSRETGIMLPIEVMFGTRKATAFKCNHGEMAMNKDQIEGKFDQLNGKIKSVWGRLSDNDIALAKGNRDQFFGKLQETYGIAKEDAQKRLNELEKSCGCGSNKTT